MFLTEEDLAKYPFLPQATDYVKQLDIDIIELTETLDEVLKYAETHVEQCFDTTIDQTRRVQPLRSPSVEVPAFPVAIIIVAAMKDNYLKKKYALCEAKKAFLNLRRERFRKVFEIARYFKCDIRPATPQTKGFREFTLDFVSYIRNTASLRQAEWKLVNRRLVDGRITLTKSELCRLLQEEVQRHIESRLNVKIPPLPASVMSIVDELKDRFSRKSGSTQMIYPQEIKLNAFPPCIKSLQNAISKGHHLSHIGRFTLTTFFINIGMTAEDIIDLFRSLSDFDERLTRYQVDHIAGGKGSGIKYTPPTCLTLQTHRVCVDRNEGCRSVKHPLAYYRKALSQN